MAKIRNMGTATMRINEGVVISGSISANATNNEVIRIISFGIQREMINENRLYCEALE